MSTVNLGNSSIHDYKITKIANPGHPNKEILLYICIFDVCVCDYELIMYINNINVDMLLLTVMVGSGKTFLL